MGFQTTRMASEYFVVDESKVTELPDEMPWLILLDQIRQM